MDNSNFLTPSEIMHYYPRCPFNNWDLGRLLSMGLLQGKKLHRSCIIERESLESLIEYYKQHHHA